MNGIIFCVCLTLVISVLQIVLKWCRKERKKIQVKKESQQNRSRWWNWSRDAAKGLLMCYLPLHQKVRGKPDMKVNFFWDRELSSIIERYDPLYTLTHHQATQNGMLIKLDLLKSGNLMNWWKIEQDLLYSHSTRTNSLLKTTIWTLTPKQNQKCRWNPDHSCTGWMIKCERGRTNPQKMQRKTATNILWYGECFCLLHHKHLYSWWRMTQTNNKPSKRQKISQWNRWSTYLRNWYLNNQTRSMEWLQLTGKTLHGSIYLWLVVKRSSISRTRRFTYFQILCCALERWTRIHNQIMHGKTGWRGSKVRQNSELWTQLMVSQWNSSGTSSQDAPHCSLSVKSKSSCQKWAYNHKISLDGLSSCRCSTTSHGDLKTMNRNAN